jgi:hypothetical protein
LRGAESAVNHKPDCEICDRTNDEAERKGCGVEIGGEFHGGCVFVAVNSLLMTCFGE